MSFPSRNLSSIAARALSIAASAVLLMAAAGEIDHALEHVESLPGVHDEASHPEASPHLEQEEHGGPGVCLVCLQAAYAVASHQEWTALGLEEASGETHGAFWTPSSLALLTGPPRAPPA